MKNYTTCLFIALALLFGVCPKTHAQGATGPLAEIAPLHQGILVNFKELKAYKALSTGKNSDKFYAEEGEHPALIKVEGLIPDPLGKYYLYHSPHDHDGTGLLYSDSIEGPWTEYQPNGELGPLPTLDNPRLNRDTMHACPDVCWMEEYGEFFLWAHENNDYTDLFRSKDGITWKFDSTAIHRKNVHPNAKNATYTRCHKYPVERDGITYKYIMVYSSAIKGAEQTVRSVWLAYSNDGINWIQETKPLISPIPAESKEGASELAMFGPEFITYKGKNYVTYQGNLSGKGGKLRYVELDQNLTPVGSGGTRYLLIDPELVRNDPHMSKGKSFRGSQLIVDGDTLYCISRGGADRDFFYAKKKGVDPALFGASSAPADAGLQETYESLATPPTGAVEVLSGTFTSALLDRKVPYRIFAPAKPKVGNAGMPIAIYTLNLQCTEPRPSSAADREIIEDLIQRQFLVAAVDFTGGKVTDHLEWAKDTHGLIQVFGGKWHSEQPYYTKNRKTLIHIPGPHAGKELESVPSPDSSVGETLPIQKTRMYLLPPGYTVKYHHVFNSDSGLDKRPELFFDIVYPMPSKKNRKVPVLLAQSATNAGDVVVNANSFVLYSWLFNGYALAITKNVPPAEDNLHIYPIVQAIRYLRWKAEDFSLNGAVSTAGISKAARRAFRESHFNGQASVMDDGKLPFSNESSKVSVTMPAVGAGSLLDSRGYPDYPIWENLNENSPAIVLGYHHLNPKDVAKHQGRKEKLVRDGYIAKGWKDRMLYLDVPLGAHEYNIYDLNKIMCFWDKFCKSSNQDVGRNNPFHQGRY